MGGRQDIVECTFVKSDVTSAPYFSTPCRLGQDGVQENLGMGQLSDFEKTKLQEVGGVVLNFGNNNVEDVLSLCYMYMYIRMHIRICTPHSTRIQNCLYTCM